MLKVPSFHGQSQKVCLVSGYSGVECEEVIDHCLSSPCKNDGTCLDLQNDYLCLCPDKYKGTNCEIGN